VDLFRDVVGGDITLALVENRVATDSFPYGAFNGAQLTQDPNSALHTTPLVEDHAADDLAEPRCRPDLLRRAVPNGELHGQAQ
jgi:hypothetical protein